MKGVITADIGTSSMRATLHDAAGQVVFVEQREHMPTFHNDGRVEQDPRDWQAGLSALLRSCRDAAEHRGIEPAGVALTAQRSSVIAVDRAGQPLHPAIMWQDTRTAALAGEMASANELVYRKTGSKISPVFSAIKMTWLRRNRPAIWQATHKLLGVQDWAIYLLTGRFVTDQSFGSRTNLLALATREWDPELLSLFEVESRMLCDLVAPGSIVGGLTPAMAAETGLVVGLPVISAGGDQQCAALGLGLFSAKRAVANTGTGSYLIGHSDRPVLDPEMRLSCNVAALPDAYIVEAAVLTSGAVYRWFAESILQDPDSPTDQFEALNRAAQQAPAGANGLLLLPHFKGRGSPSWDPYAKGVLFNMTLGTSRSDVARAILEGIAIEMRECLELVEDVCGKVGSISVSGGMTRADLFNQIQSDVFARPVVRFRSSEATSCGAWMAAAVALDLQSSYPQAFRCAAENGAARNYQPAAENLETYARIGRQARALYHALTTPELREAIN